MARRHKYAQAIHSLKGRNLNYQQAGTDHHVWFMFEDRTTAQLVRELLYMMTMPKQIIHKGRKPR